MSLPFKLLCTDFDGTVYTEHHDPPIPRSLREMISELQRRGVLWVINTGRELSSLMEALGRAEIDIRPDYAVVVEREIYRRNEHTFISHDPWNERCSLAHEELFGKVRDDVPALFEWINARFDATVYEDPYSPFCLIARHNDDADAIYAYLENYCRRFEELTVVRNDVYARFSHAGFNKGTALEEIARLEGIPATEILAAGDHHNDLPMLTTRYAARLLAPANAIPEVREAVWRQGGLVSDRLAGEGVASGLRQFVRIE